MTILHPSSSYWFRNSYDPRSGINRALRSSKLRDSRATDTPDDMSELGDDQNLFELHVSEATLFVSGKIGRW